MCVHLSAYFHQYCDHKLISTNVPSQPHHHLNTYFVNHVSTLAVQSCEVVVTLASLLACGVFVEAASPPPQTEK